MQLSTNIYQKAALVILSFISLAACQHQGVIQPATADHTVIADEVTVAQLQAAMKSGELTATQIVAHYLAAIER